MFIPSYLIREIEDLVENVQKVLPNGWLAGWQEDHDHYRHVFLISHPESGQSVGVEFSAEELVEYHSTHLKERIAKALKTHLSSKRLPGKTPSPPQQAGE